MSAADLLPIAVLIDELKHEDCQARLRSMQRLEDIASALGADRTRDELIPFLSDDMDDDDEVLREFAAQLGRLLEAVGGAAHAMTLLMPLEQLASVEDSAVREKATESIAGIARAVSAETLVAEVVPILQRLAGREWFTARISACTMCPLLFAALAASGGAVAAHCDTVQSTFLALVRDETPMVRRAAMIALGPLARAMGPGSVATNKELLSAFGVLAEDQQDSVRLFAIDACVDFAAVLSSAGSKAHVLPLSLKLAEDTSWRVRWSVANKFVALCDAVGDEAANAAVSDAQPKSLLDAHEQLLQDTEMEVRAVAAVTVADMAKKMTSARARAQLLPLVNKLVRDDCEHVRIAVASVIMALGATVTKMGDSSVFMAEMIPMYLELLKDAKSDVRLNIIAKLGDGGKGVDRELSHSLQPAINDLAQDRQWRVRVAVIELMPSLAERLGEDFFTEALRAAVKNIAMLTAQFGMEWAQSYVVDQLLELVDAGHIHRMTFCLAVQELAPIFVRHDGITIYLERFLPALRTLATNEVPNVRFSVAKAMQATAVEAAGSAGAAEIEAIIRPVLRRFLEDDDVDVTFFANSGLLALSKK